MKFFWHASLESIKPLGRAEENEIILDGRCCVDLSIQLDGGYFFKTVICFHHRHHTASRGKVNVIIGCDRRGRVHTACVESIFLDEFPGVCISNHKKTTVQNGVNPVAVGKDGGDFG